jgi:hypothetical protein
MYSITAVGTSRACGDAFVADRLAFCRGKRPVLSELVDEPFAFHDRILMGIEGRGYIYFAEWQKDELEGLYNTYQGSWHTEKTG